MEMISTEIELAYEPAEDRLQIRFFMQGPGPDQFVPIVLQVPWSLLRATVEQDTAALAAIAADLAAPMTRAGLAGEA